MITSVSAELPLARFIRERRHIRNDNTIRSEALCPRANPETGRKETSVFRIDDLEEKEIWELGEEHVPLHVDGQPHPGRAEFIALHVSEVGLSLDPGDIPPRHADIVGWSEEKEVVKQTAMELAAKVSFVRNPSAGDPDS